MPDLMEGRMCMPLQVDVNFEGPLTQALALATAQRQQRSKQEQYRQPPARERDEVVAATSLSDAATGNHPGLPLASLKATELLNPIQHASIAISEPGLTAPELVLGCMRRVFSADYMQALLQCQAGGHAALS